MVALTKDPVSQKRERVFVFCKYKMKTIRYLSVILILILLLTSCGTTNRAKADKTRNENCARNQKIKIAVFPLQNDVYGATDEIISRFHQECFQVVERMEISKIVDEMKLQASGLTENAQLEIGKLLNVNAIIAGSVYTITVPYYPSPTQPPPSNVNAVGYAFGAGVGEALKRMQTGTTLYANYRIIDARTGRILKVITDEKIRKISQ